MSTTRGAALGALLTMLFALPLQAQNASPPTEFGFLERFVGRQLVSRSYTLDIAREGDALALAYGFPGSRTIGRYLLRAGATPGEFALLETLHESSSRGRRAYFDASGALVLEFNSPGNHNQTRFELDGEVLRQRDFSGVRALGIKHKLEQQDDFGFYPATSERLQMAKGYSDSEALRYAEEQREAKRERDEQWTRNMNAINAGLQQATDEAAAREARSRAALDATLQAAQIQAQRERAENERAERDRARRDRDTAAAATAAQEQIARDRAAQVQTQREQARPTQTAPASASPATPKAATTASSTSAAAAPRTQGCTQVHPKVNTLFTTVRGEAIGLQGARDGAAQFCTTRTGQSGYTGTEKCTADGPYMLHCTIEGRCNGLASQTCGNSQ